MKKITAISINLKKLKHRTKKAMFLIIPITALVSLSIIISSQVKNIQKAMDESIFGEIEEESTVLEIVYEREDMGDMRGGPQLTSSSEYTELDLEEIESIENVENASINYSLPISNIETSDLFEEATISITVLSALDEEMASLYTPETFTYSEGAPIPIILNANQFRETYEDWGGEDSITIDFQDMRKEPGEEVEEGEESGELMQVTPIKTRAIDYDKEDLIGKSFTIKFGGFEDVATYEIEREDMGVNTFIKLTEDEIAAEEAARETAVSTYWDYDKLAEGITYNFIVVGVIDSSTNQKSYIPEEFANVLMSDYIQNQLDSRNSTEMDTDDLNSSFTGLSFDGTELASASSMVFARGFGGGGIPGGMMGGGMMEGMRPGEESEDSEDDSESYEIPGLVVQVSGSDTSDVEGIYTDTNVFEDSIKTGDTISVKITSIYDRAQAVEDINEAGYAYQDTNDLEVFSNIQNTLNQVSTGVIIGFIALTIAIIILTMSKFVSESTKEIGIYRAIGFTKKNILLIFIMQSVIYTTVGYLIGVAIGFVGNILASSIAAAWFDSVVAETVQETFNVVADVDKTIFTGFDINSIALLSAILFGLTIIISIIPAYRASMISPVEAIKTE